MPKQRTRIEFTSVELDLLDDALDYYRQSDMGGGDRDNLLDRRRAGGVAIKIGLARERVARTGAPPS